MNIYKQKEMCTGCSACANVCPRGCIEMVADKYGFLYPQVDQSRCTKCGLCKTHCHTWCEPVGKNISDQLFSFAILDKTELIKSSSGGAFYAIASKILRQGGFICGAVYDDRWVVRHIVSNCSEDIERMHGSKYSQSILGNCFSEIKTRLEEGKTVLFIGNPCQVLGLKTFLGKDYAQLFLVDFICHSVPSPKIFASYIQLLENKLGKVKNFNFRNKKFGWANYCIYVEGERASKYLPHKGNPYIDAFLDGVYHRECCNICPVKTRSGYQSDITIGDFWRYETISLHKNYELDAGVSAVIINTEKGKQLLDQETLYEEDMQMFVQNNRKIRECAKESEKSKVFWENFSKKGLEYAYKKLNQKTLIIRIKTSIKNLITKK